MHAASLVSFLALAGSAFAGTYYEHLPFDGPNPFNVGLSLYVPDGVQDNSPLVVAAHPCSANATLAYKNYGVQHIADQYKFPVIYPDTPHDNTCWDVTSLETRTHNGGGDSQGIVSMTKYIAKKYKSDLSRIFVTGFSSGGMMTELLAAVYPEVYAAGVAFSGVAFGCCTVPDNAVDQMCPVCADGNVTHTGAEWAEIVKAADPGYDGYRPHMVVAHGTVDSILNYHNFGEAIKEWTSVLNVSETPVSTELNTPNPGWTKTVYGEHDEFEAYSVYNVGHSLFDVPIVAKFFDLACPPGGMSCLRRNDIPNARFQQCGGKTWTGSSVCSEGKCVKINDYYSQCQ